MAENSAFMIFYDSRSGFELEKNRLKVGAITVVSLFSRFTCHVISNIANSFR
jgi:hypothetical protein